MKTTAVLSVLFTAAAAFPATLNQATVEAIAAKAVRDLGSDPLGISKSQTNCGPTPCLVFDPQEQEVSVTGANAYASPAPNQIRGPCPGLNAAANHGYLPRSGIASIEETVSGLGAAFGLSAEICAFLAAYAIATGGNVVEGVWSIGGPLPPDYLTGNLIGTGQGLSYSHNTYEGDASIGRNDIYPSGDAHSLNITKFTGVYALGGTEDRYTLDKFRQRLESVQDAAIASNPYYFAGAFGPVAVVPAAYNFVINLMSNHSAAEPSGYLDGYNFKSFFAVSGTPGNFKWNKGQERIPNNWYRRPSSTQYTGADLALDVAIGYAAYPRSLKFGGNTGKVNTFTGVDVGNLTNGVFNADTLFQGNNFACFIFALANEELPDFLSGPIAAVNAAIALVAKYTAPITQPLQCPQLGQFKQGLFNQFPGRTYNPKGTDTNYKN